MIDKVTRKISDNNNSSNKSDEKYQDEEMRKILTANQVF